MRIAFRQLRIYTMVNEDMHDLSSSFEFHQFLLSFRYKIVKVEFLHHVGVEKNRWDTADGCWTSLRTMVLFLNSIEIRLK